MIEDDKLIRETRIQNQHGYIAIHRDCIITKEEFLECFNEWVVNEWIIKPSQENPISSQTEFFVPVDNGGVTPV